MTRQVEKSALDRIPSYLEKIVDKMNMEHNKLANDYMVSSSNISSHFIPREVSNQSSATF